MYYLCNAYSGRLFVFRGVCLILDTEIRQIFYSEDDVTRLHLMFVVLLQPIVWVAGCNEYKRGYCSRFGIRCLAIPGVRLATVPTSHKCNGPYREQGHKQ